MNLFTTSDNPQECAKNLDDVLLKVTIVESAQMLSTAINCNDNIKEKPTNIYKSHNANEIHNKWVRASKSNYKWTVMYLMACLNEYYFRFGKVHDTTNIAQYFSLYENYFPLIDMAPFPRQFAQKYENYDYLMGISNIFQAYKEYLITKWNIETLKGKQPKWTNREKPIFYQNDENVLDNEK